MSDIKERLQRAKRRQSPPVDVCLRGDLAGEHEELQRQLEKLPPGNKLSGDPERQRIQAEMDRVSADMRADTVQFVLRALSDKAFQTLVDEHPPRRAGDQVDEGDAETGYDRSTFRRALIQACVIEPTLDDDDWDLIFAEALGPAEVLKLYEEATRIHGKVDVPFSPAASSESPD